MDSTQIIIIVAAAVIGGVALTFVGVLIQWSLRKARPHPDPISHPASEEAAVAAETPSDQAVAPQAEAFRPEIERPKPPEPVRLWSGLRKTREGFLARLKEAIAGSRGIDEVYEGLEEALIAADVGVEASAELVRAVRDRLGNSYRPEAVAEALKEEIGRVLMAIERPLKGTEGMPLVIMLVGVNGVGKTTTVAKLAARLKAERGSVVVAAADTFRAAAIDQLQVWCERVGVDLIKQNPGSDPAAVAFDAVKAAVSRKAGAVLIDTAGRLQTRVNLMEELKKIARVVGRDLPGAPHETWLVLDATAGQNALVQARVFGEAVGLTGVVLAKLDSSAKGGVIVAIASRLGIPVRFVGVGEQIGDLRAFDSAEYVQALFTREGAGSDPHRGSYAA